MRKFRMSLIIISLLFIFNIFVSGQSASVLGKATVIIIDPIIISNVRDLDFGNVSPGETSGSVVLEPTAASPRTSNGGVTLQPGSGTVQSAKFNAKGADGLSFNIELPTSITITNGTHSMVVDHFASTPSGSGIFTSGTIQIYVGATLHVNAHQEPGIYKSLESFEVIISYE